MFANAFGAEHLNIRHVETAVHVSTLSLSSFSLCFIFFSFISFNCMFYAVKIKDPSDLYSNTLLLRNEMC
jgi:hypothetical protein